MYEFKKGDEKETLLVPLLSPAGVDIAKKAASRPKWLKSNITRVPGYLALKPKKCIKYCHGAEKEFSFPCIAYYGPDPCH